MKPERNETGRVRIVTKFGDASDNQKEFLQDLAKETGISVRDIPNCAFIVNREQTPVSCPSCKR